MSADVIIRAEGLGKRYRIGRRPEGRYKTLRDVISERVGATARNVSRMLRGSGVTEAQQAEDFWALRDVSFDIRRGEVVGIIGRNGAGKSTLLKVLSRITEPTEGRVVVRGRMASLLEVGTGFHPELTGRENIYLNGAILGMSRAEIRRDFDEIVAFAEVEDFLDTPVKRYSSGMYVRLAFAVAAHLEPEILVVDEVLAVGDAEFQKKCLGKMRNVAGHGRAVLFVSHNMAAVQALCGRGLVLARGRVDFDGLQMDAITVYNRTNRTAASASVFTAPRPSWATRLILEASIGRADDVNGPLTGRDDLLLRFAIDLRDRQSICTPNVGFTIAHETKGLVGGLNTKMSGALVGKLPLEEVLLIDCRLSCPRLLPGSYSVSLWLSDNNIDVDYVEDALQFTIEPTDIYETGVPVKSELGLIYFDGAWNWSGSSRFPEQAGI